MSALADAIRHGQQRSDLGTTSPFSGLRRRHARTIDVVAQSVAATAPAGVLLVHPGALFGRSGSFAYLDIVLTITLVIGIALVIGIFARRIASTGSLHTFTARGLGPRVGLIGGTALAVGYLAIAMNTLWSGAGRIASVVAASPEPPPPLTAAIVAVTAVVIAVVIARGLRISTRILLVLETVAVLAVLVLSVIALTATKWDVARLIPRAQDFSMDAVMIGVAFSLIGFVGFESGVALGPETRRPFAAIPRAILISVGATGFVMLVGTAAQLSLLSEDPAAGALAEVTGLRTLIDLIVGVSFLACALAMTNAATRVAFALSREGVIPPLFGRVSRRGVPALGAVALTVIVAAIPLSTLAAGGSRQDMRAITAPASTLGFLIAYALMCAAAPAFLAKIGELSARAVIVSVVPLLALATVLGFYGASATRGNPVGFAWAVGILAVLVVAGMVRLARRPGVAARVGLHDWPVDADTIAAQVPAAESDGEDRTGSAR
ncbi:hypothetical protein ASD65_07260 [Microbacterium sp. Root61]|uniref:APC family permease n=1 Tax=Microbacterium sp. Root61 TaxID=1736570 RepID=UPI00070124FA|nr:APC family permease [Microbacterium sp. Root61]KRA24242.1 hypothetical protein ASD65_07260 [Microbacterium sp. Root61]